jgi:hypothetical protein
MQYTIIKKIDYILFEVSGEYDFSLFKKIVSKVKTECEALQIKKALVDACKVEHLFYSEMERFYLAEEIVQQLGHQIKLAGLGKKEDITYYGEKVARKRGANMKAFWNRDLALEWLLN